MWERVGRHGSEGWVGRGNSFVHVGQTIYDSRARAGKDCSSARGTRAPHKPPHCRMHEVPKWPVRTVSGVLAGDPGLARVAVRRDPLPMRVRKLGPYGSGFGGDAPNFRARTGRRICKRAPRAHQQGILLRARHGARSMQPRQRRRQHHPRRAASARQRAADRSGASSAQPSILIKP